MQAIIRVHDTDMVDVIVWHYAGRELPKESGEYLGKTIYGYVNTFKFSKKWGKFNCIDEQSDDHTAIPMAMWAETPKGPDIDLEVE